MERVQQWYNGYNYLSEPIYNPYDILKFIAGKFKFKNYWWQSGNPSFLIEALKTSNFYLPSLDKLIVGINFSSIERNISDFQWSTI